jgi:membrane-associated phospholipid phosphatase
MDAGMTGAVVAIGNRYLPRGWRDFWRQIAIWFGFLLAYQVARGIADRNPVRAFENGLWVIEIEQHATGLIELSLQRTVVGLMLLWVYLRRNDRFYRFRNWILLANAIGLIGYVTAPTAPPRMFGVFGFEDTLFQFGSLNHGSGLVELASNPYAAMPSLHAADALIVGVSMAMIVKSRWLKALWLAWPAWVWFSVMATANHFWLDIAAGILVALIAGAVLYR